MAQFKRDQKIIIFSHSLEVHLEFYGWAGLSSSRPPISTPDQHIWHSLPAINAPFKTHTTALYIHQSTYPPFTGSLSLIRPFSAAHLLTWVSCCSRLSHTQRFGLASFQSAAARDFNALQNIRKLYTLISISPFKTIISSKSAALNLMKLQAQLKFFTNTTTT